LRTLNALVQARRYCGGAASGVDRPVDPDVPLEDDPLERNALIALVIF
jgi:hypothetical protein